MTRNFHEKWAGWRRIAVDKESAKKAGWVLDYNITLNRLEDVTDMPLIVPTIGLRKDGHAGKPAEGAVSRVIAGFFDSEAVQWVTLEVCTSTIQTAEGTWVPGPNPVYEVQVYNKAREVIDADGWGSLEQAMKDFVSKTAPAYSKDDPMEWFDVVDKQSTYVPRVIPEGYGSWA